MTTTRPIPRDSGVLRLIRRPGARRWLLDLARREARPDIGRAELVRRLNRAIAAPGEPRRD
jgi:hypothetical protein